MNNKIANIVVDYIKDLPWIEKLAGMTQVARIYQTSDGAKIEKRYPISCQLDYEDACKEGCYDELVPNSKYRSVVYFEDGSFSYRERRGKRLYYESNIRLVAWLNYKLLEGAGCGSTGEYILDIIQALPEIPVDIDNMRGMTITVISQARRDSGIFSKYTYNEFATQYMLIPYDYFALDIRTEFFVIPECHEPNLEGCIEC